MARSAVGACVLLVVLLIVGAVFGPSLGDRLGVWRKERAAFGGAVAFLGDVDGDGSPDFLIGEPCGNPLRGSVFAVSGARGQVLYRVRGEPTAEGFGMAVFPIADIDGDGAPDFAVGVPFAHPGEWLEGAAPYAGEVSLFSGRGGKLIRAIDGSALSGAGVPPDGRAGGAVSTAGDVDGDGVPDVAIGLPELESGRGLVVVVSGKDGRVVRRIPRERDEREFGKSLAGGADFDSDGVADLVVGIPGARRHGVFGDGRVRILSGKDGRAMAVFEGGAAKTREGEQAGLRVALLPDIDGDGTADVFAAGGYDGGRLLGFSGQTGRLLTEWRPPKDHDYFQDSITVLPDVDGDRLPEVVYAQFVGTGSVCDFGFSEVVALSSGVDESGAGNVLWTYQGTMGAPSCNLEVASGGDIDRDGCPDVLVGEQGAPSGSVTVLSGRSGAVIYRVKSPLW